MIKAVVHISAAGMTLGQRLHANTVVFCVMIGIPHIHIQNHAWASISVFELRVVQWYNPGGGPSRHITRKLFSVYGFNFCLLHLLRMHTCNSRHTMLLRRRECWDYRHCEGGKELAEYGRYVVLIFYTHVYTWYTFPQRV